MHEIRNRSTPARQSGHDADDVVIRTATESDVESVAAIERACFSDPWSPAAFRPLVARPGVLFTVAEVRGGGPGASGGSGGEREEGERARVVGYVVAWLVVDEAEIANVAVAADARGRGVGGRLVDHALSVLHAQGVHSVFLEVRASNQAAMRLYESRGFTELARRRNYYRRPVEDAVIMKCRM